jgi:hypothetical protein
MVFASSKCSDGFSRCHGTPRKYIKNMGLPVLSVKMLSFWSDGHVVDCLYVADNSKECYCLVLSELEISVYVETVAESDVK